MESEKLIEDLDTLWFFSNVLSPPSTTIDATEIIQQSLSDSPKPIQQIPISPIIQTTQIDEASDGSIDQFEAITKWVSDTLEAMESVELEKKEEEERRSCKRKGKVPKMKELIGFGQLGFSFADIELDGGLVPSVDRFEVSRKMPPIDDGMAMKKRLKSWAHAVACTVR